MKLSFNKLCNIIDDAVKNEKVIDFYIKGDLAKRLIDYLECEHGMPECEDCEYENVIDDYKVYSLSLDVKDEFQFFLEEAYFNGVLLENDGWYTYCSYVDKACKITQTDRINGNRVFFDLEEDELHECCDCEGCDIDKYPTLHKVAENAMVVPYLLDRIENLESEVEKLKGKSYVYTVNDIEISKETYEKLKNMVFDEQIERIENNIMRRLWQHSR